MSYAYDRSGNVVSRGDDSGEGDGGGLAVCDGGSAGVDAIVDWLGGAVEGRKDYLLFGEEVRAAMTGGLRNEAVSNPYRDGDSCGSGWTQFEGAARPSPWGTDSDAPDATATEYAGEVTTVTDAAGKKRSVKVDGLGRVVEVTEDPGGKNYVTTYTWNALDNLTGVTQGGRNRTFGYSSLSRLTAAVNPESQTTSYTYDDNGNLASRTDGRGVTATFGSYDELNRPVSKSYSDGFTPAVSYGYDSCAYGRGRLCTVSAGVSQIMLGYNALGQVAARTQTVNGVSYTSSYHYNHADGVTRMTLAEGATAPRVVSYEYTQAGRVKNVYAGEVVAGGARYARDVTYCAGGAEKSLTLGNEVVEDTSYNGRGQMTGKTAVRQGVQLWGLGLSYGANGANNGNVMSQTVTHGAVGTAAVVQMFTYDPLDRLKSVADGGLGTQTYAYDRWGNRALVAGSYQAPGYGGGVTVSSDSESLVAAAFPNNRLAEGVAGIGPVHDGAGSVTMLESRGMRYDGEGRVDRVTKSGTPVEEWRYDYDGEGRRVREVVMAGSTVTRDTHFVYDAGGGLIRDSVRVGPAPAGGVQYVMADWLGSTRLLTGIGGSVDGRKDYLPFGEEVRATGAESRVKFTGKEREDYANLRLDYFGARYYGSGVGRFTSPDRPFADQWASDPQSWNLYAYVGNNPLRFIDSRGQWKTEVHNAIIKGSFARLSESQQSVLIHASEVVDGFLNGGQTSALSFQHGMRGSGQNADEARAMADRFIATHERQASRLASEGGGLTEAALYEFGLALHTISDRLSPAHAGEQLWTGGGEPGRTGAIGPGGIVLGAGIDGVRAAVHAGREKTLSLKEYHRAVDAERSAFLRTFGQGAFERATGCKKVVGCAYDDSQLPNELRTEEERRK